MPFAALITLAVLFLPRKDALLLVGANVVLFQAVGYGLMHWPFSMASIPGIAELVLACGLCSVAAMLVQRGLRGHGTLTVISVFLASFIVYEVAIVALSSLRASHEVVGLQTHLYVLYLNGLAFAGLLALQGIATSLGIPGPRLALAVFERPVARYRLLGCGEAGR